MLAFFGVALVAIAGLYGAYYRWTSRVRADLAIGAEGEWERLQRLAPASLAGIARAEFDALYVRTKFPRFPGYALATLAIFFLAAPAIFTLLAAIDWAAAYFEWTPQPDQVVERFLMDGDKLRVLSGAPPEAALYYLQDISGFYYFFGLIASWLFIVWFMMRRYYRRRLGLFHEELIRWRLAHDKHADSDSPTQA